MKTRKKLIALELLGVMFDLISVGVFLSFIFFLYGALANSTPWPYLGWLLVVSLIARQSGVAMKDAKQRIEYVDQLLARGYERQQAAAAWRISSRGGSNLLRNLQQAETKEQIDQPEKKTSTYSNGETGE